MNVKNADNRMILLILALLTTAAFCQSAGIIDLNNLENYANQPVPNYINKDNTPPNNQISDAEATLGRVLFYDKKISVNNTIACASCHQQAFAFSDTAMGQHGRERHHWTPLDAADQRAFCQRSQVLLGRTRRIAGSANHHAHPGSRGNGF